MKSMNSGSAGYARIVAAALAIAISLAGCTGLPPGAQAPTVTISDFGVGNAGLFEQQFNLKLRIQNPNPEEFKVDGMAFDLEINDQQFARGVGNEMVTVPRYGSAFMSVEAVSTLGGLMKQFGRIVQGDKPIFKYRLKGNLSIAGGTRIPFEQLGEFDFTTLAPRNP